MQEKIDFTERDLVKEPLQEEEVHALAEKLQLTAKELINIRSKAFKNLGLGLEEIDDDHAARIIRENGRIMVRPVLERGDRAIKGFKEDIYRNFLSL